MSHENHHLKDFTDFNDFENLKKELTCFKSTSSTTIDLFLINRKGCFMKSLTNKTGKSDHHKVIYTFLYSHFIRTNFNKENYFFKKIFLKISKTLIICLKVFMTLSQTLYIVMLLWRSRNFALKIANLWQKNYIKKLWQDPVYQNWSK